MAFETLVTQGFSCQLAGYYRLDKDLYDECLNGLPAYSDCLICGIDAKENARAVTYFLPQGEIFDRKKLSALFTQNYLYELIFFDAAVDGIPVFGIPGMDPVKINASEWVNSFISLVGFENKNSYLFKEQIVSGTLENVCIYILRELSIHSPELFEQLNQRFDNERLLKILTHIHENLSSDITLENLAELVFLSADYISQFFKRCIGMSIQAYLIDQRVKSGLHELATSQDQISVIAEKTGFIDQAYFNRRFKMVYGMNPLRLRKRYQLLYVSQAGFLMAFPNS